MREPSAAAGWALLAGAILSLGTASGCANDRFGLPPPASEQGGEVLRLWRVLFLTGAAIGILVAALILWSVVRYRRRGDAPPPQFRDNVRLELLYTAVPLVVVAVLLGLTLRTQGRVTDLSRAPDVRVDVTGFQWGWRFHYAGTGVTVVGDSNRPPTLVLPAGSTVAFRLASADVIHSFFVPAFITKRDLVPGMQNRIDVDTTRLGRFSGVCAEFCGLDHARMSFTVEVMRPTDYSSWLAARQPPPSEPGPPGPSDTAPSQQAAIAPEPAGP